MAQPGYGAAPFVLSAHYRMQPNEQSAAHTAVKRSLIKHPEPPMGYKKAMSEQTELLKCCHLPSKSNCTTLEHIWRIVLWSLFRRTGRHPRAFQAASHVAVRLFCIVQRGTEKPRATGS